MSSNNKSDMCNHHNYHVDNGTPQGYLQAIDSIFKKLSAIEENQTSSSASNDFLKNSLQILGDGFCQRCAPIALIVLDKTLTVPYDPEHSLLINRSTIHATYLSNCLQSPSIANFMVKHEQCVLHCHWKIMLKQYPVCIENITLMCDAITFNVAASKSDVERLLDLQFKALAAVGYRISSNIAFLTQSNWCTLIKLSGDFEAFLQFIECQMVHGFYLKYAGGLCVIRHVLTLIIFGLHFMKVSGYSIAIQNEITGCLHRLGLKLRKNNKMQHGDDMIQLLVAFGNEKRLVVMQQAGLDHARKLCKESWRNMECANIGCNVQRKDKDCLYKCSKCRVVRYCSTRCQKVDWNKNNHRLYCMAFQKLTRTINL